MKPPKHLVTGGVGFIGSNLVRKLPVTGASVRVVDDLSTGKSENPAGLSGVEIVQGDLSEMPLNGVLEGIDVIFHLGAVPSVPRSVADPMRSHAAPGIRASLAHTAAPESR